MSAHSDGVENIVRSRANRAIASPARRSAAELESLLSSTPPRTHDGFQVRRAARRRSRSLGGIQVAANVDLRLSNDWNHSVWRKRNPAER